MSKKKSKIGIMFGGNSSEKEVSLEGGRNVFLKMNEEKYEKIPIFVDSSYKLWKINERLIVQNTVKDIERLCKKEAKQILYEDLKKNIDFAFIIGHGKYMEDGCLQGFLELQNIAYNGPGILGSALGADKYVSRRILESVGIDVPKTLAIKSIDWKNEKEKIIKQISNEFGFPCIIKPSREGCSTAICKVKSVSEIKSAASEAFKWDSLILVEEFLEGREITVSVNGNESLHALPITETPPSGMAEFLTLEDKFLPGGAEMITPADILRNDYQKAQEIAIKVCMSLNLIGYPRIDMFYTNDKRIVVLEANNLPGITPSTMIFHQAAEIDLSPSQYIDKIIELGINAHQNKRGPL